ncbi:MAG: tetratricopeptide repeat protein [Tannerella sp.]|jgi:hypothetical protein|nr:tetratricopeptide repeat protein [Tannerella sp.]
MIARSYFISAIFCLLLCSCGKENKLTNALLYKAEQMLMQNPDSTLLLLSQIPEKEVLRDVEQAKYCLLYTAATFRNYETQSDSMISMAVRYYEKHGTKSQKAEAYYYAGCVAEDLNDAPRAQNYYKKALESCNYSGNYSLSGRIASRIAMLYTEQYVYNAAIPYFEKAFDYYSLENDSVRQSVILRNMGRAYTMMHQTDHAIEYYRKALLFAGDNKQSILSELGDIYITKEMYDIAFEYIRRSLEQSAITGEPYHTYLSYGKLFYLTGQKDSANYYLTKSLDSHVPETCIDAYEFLAKIKKDEKNWDEYAYIQEQREILAEQIHEQTYTETVTQMEHLYNYQHAEKALTESEIRNMNKKSVILICIIIIAILSMLLIIGIHYLRKEKAEKLLQKQRYEKWKKEQLRNSWEQIEPNKQYILQLENKLHTIDLENGLAGKLISEDEFEQLSMEKERLYIENRKIEYANKERQQLIRQIRKADIYQKFHAEGGFKATESDWLELQDLINHTFPQFPEQLHSLLPKISDIEFKVCCLVKIEVPTADIANTINRSRQSVTMIRKRLYQKIYGENGSTKDFDEFIAGL